jgi:hypothetical protein
MLKLKRLYKILERNLRIGKPIDSILESIEVLESDIFEDTSATGGPSGSAGASVGSIGTSLSSGMGPVVNSQPSSLPGSLNGDSYSNYGGMDGSGDVSIPYNALGKKVFHKASMGKSHGSFTGKKSREKKLDLKALKKSLSDKPKSIGKIKNFGDFNKDNVNLVTKIKEN